MGADLKSLILSYDRQVPRYTSYPTAPHFQEITQPNYYEETLANLKENSTLSLYIHVPFCQKMCWYCGCHTKVTARYAPVEDYIHMMMREVDILSEHIKPHQRVTHIHFGGGSPTMINAADFTAFMRRMRSVFAIEDDAEIAMEIDPRGVTEAHVAAYAENGVNRVSMGIQDFDERVMDSVNRHQPFFVSYDAVNMMRNYGIARINADFMYGLPYQTLESFEKSLGMLRAISPDRISVFGYAHVPWLKKHMGMINDNDLPGNELRYDLNELAYQTLTSQGYVPIGIDHFARPIDTMVAAKEHGKLHRNFQGYTTDNADALIGIGASSISKLPGLFIQNAVAMPHYREKILGGHLSAMKYRELSPEDILRAKIIEQLMCYFSCDVAKLCKESDVPPEFFDTERRRLQQYCDNGLLAISDDFKLDINPQARGIVRIIASEFDAYLAQTNYQTSRHARAV